jgi:hypothetical protein
MQWLATAFIIVYTDNLDTTQVMGITFLATIVYAYFGFKVPKG